MRKCKIQINYGLILGSYDLYLCLNFNIFTIIFRLDK